VDQQNAYQFAVEVCQQVGVQLPSFDQLGQTSGATGVKVGVSAILGVVIGMFLFVGGLL
jgi:hypothetical protein